MNSSNSTSRRTLLTIIAALIATALIGCAATPPSPSPPNESQLLAAGFKVIPAKTVQQQEHLQALSQNALTEWQRNGKHFFIYPDVAKKQLYVGTPKEYEAYRRIVPASGPTLAQQENADMASYAKQDAGMQFNNNRDLADPYYFWDSFDGLDWR